MDNLGGTGMLGSGSADTLSKLRSQQANYEPRLVTYERVPTCDAVHILCENIYLVADMLFKEGIDVSVSPGTQGVLAVMTIKDRGVTTAVQVNDVLVRDDLGFHGIAQEDFYRDWRRRAQAAT